MPRRDEGEDGGMADQERQVWAEVRPRSRARARTGLGVEGEDDGGRDRQAAEVSLAECCPGRGLLQTGQAEDGAVGRRRGRA